ncbi:hypothetical protein [Streptomyces sp. NRRL S-1824]|uniref:hypothetical protein n=1 Tax=Streptomyces sp. NRRL S-1824 TaxID=1463889 RepID=UPI0018FF5A10|nr:hypothetical protein [Streptomyces sp. NRRL S-1824]
MPSDFHQPIIAATFGTVTHAIFPVAGQRDGNAEIAAASGMETLNIISRLQASDVDTATLDALRITTDRLCSEYPYLPSGQLAAEGRQWLKHVAGLQAQRLTLAQHREVLTLSGWLALGADGTDALHDAVDHVAHRFGMRRRTQVINA